MAEQIDNTINWFEDAIVKGYFKYYDYQHFSNIKEIGTGNFGKVYRANWKNSPQYLALKSFEFNVPSVNEIVQELKLQRDVDFHDNVIRFYGITLDDSKKNFSLVMEYANGGTLRQYLKKNFKKLTWDDKLSFAYQLTCAVSCLHNEDIVHSDLHSGNILVHQNKIKLADFGLSKRIKEASCPQSKLVGVIPYIDPKNFIRQRDDNGKKKVYSFNKKSDIYSVGVLLWEISSGQPPFQDDMQYDVGLAIEISQGEREKPIPGTPVEYFELYTKCWDNDPDNRPTISEVIDRLKEIMPADDSENLDIIVDMQNASIDEFPSDVAWNIEELKEVLGADEILSNESLNKFLSKEFLSKAVNFIDNSLSDERLNKNIINNISNLLLNNRNNDSGSTSGTNVINQSPHEEDLNKNFVNIRNFLLNNQNNDSGSTSGTNDNNQSSVELYRGVSDSESDTTKYSLAFMHRDGIGVDKDDVKAFELFKESAEEGHLNGMNMLGECYYDGRGIDRDRQKALEWFQKAADLGNNAAKYNLGRMYQDGDIVEKDEEKAHKLFKSSAMEVNLLANSRSGGTRSESEIEFYRRIARIGTKVGQMDLNKIAETYQQGEGLIKVLRNLIDHKI